MTSLYDQIKNLINASEDTVIFTWDTFHLLITVLIFIALMILIWVNRLDHCVKNNNSDRNKHVVMEHIMIDFRGENEFA